MIGSAVAVLAVPFPLPMSPTKQKSDFDMYVLALSPMYVARPIPPYSLLGEKRITQPRDENGG